MTEAFGYPGRKYILSSDGNQWGKMEGNFRNVSLIRNPFEYSFGPIVSSEVVKPVSCPFGGNPRLFR